MSSDMNGVMAIEAFNKLSKRVGAVGQEQEYVIGKPYPVTGLVKFGMKEILFKKVHEQVSIGWGHLRAHDGSLNLEVMLGV